MESENNDYAHKLIHILNTEFSDWEAKREGIIDKNGNLLKVPTDAQRQEMYTDLHVIIRSVKRTLDALGKTKSIPFTAKNIKKLSEMYNIDINDLMVDPYLKEAMVVGDGEYNADNIASGDVSGAIVNGGPNIPGKKAKVEKRKRAIVKVK